MREAPRIRPDEGVPHLFEDGFPCGRSIHRPIAPARRGFPSRTGPEARVHWPVLSPSSPGFRLEATLAPGGLHFWAPEIPPAEVAAWIREQLGDRWPDPEDPAESAAEPVVEGAPAPGLTLGPLPAAATLAATEPPPGTADGRADSLRFWSLASRFLLDLLARGRFRPALSRNGTESASVWLPDLGAQQRELDALRLAAPERALGGLDPETAIPRYLVAAGDSVVRDAGRRLGWPLAVSRAPGARRATIERVLDDLFAGASAGLGGGSAAAFARARRALGARKPGPAAVIGNTRLAFVLEPPPVGTGEWRIRFRLGAGEPDAGAELRPLAEVWEADDAAANLRRFGVAEPVIPLLANLGRAARVFPLLERGLAAAAPEECAVSAGEAYDFLHEGGEALKQLGFEVRIPPSLAGRRPRRPTLELTVGPVSDGGSARPTGGSGAGQGSLGLDALVSYRWQVAVGEQSWSLDEFRRLTRGTGRLVRSREGWVELDQDSVDRLFREAARRRARAGRAPVLRDALRERLQLSPPSTSESFEPDEEEVEALARIEGEAWIGSLFRALEAAADQLGPLDPPAGLRTELRPYQRVGYRWLRLLADHGLGGCLADDMGLGKTCQALTFLLAEQEAGRLNRPWVLVCPNSIVATWRKEAERFAPSLRLHARQGPGRSRGADFERAVAASDLVVCSFGITHRDFDLLRGVRWGGLIVDEAQNLKNPSAKQTRAVRRLDAPVRFALTGTPLENRLTDLWSIMEIVNPGFLGPERTFRRTFAAAVEGAQDEQATSKLRRLVRPFILRRLKTDPRVIRDLPEKHQTRVYCNLTPEQAALYQAAVDDCLEKIRRHADIARRGAILSTLTRLKQICNHPENFLRLGGPLAGRSGKLTRLIEILTEVRQKGERALVFTQFAEMAMLLGPHLAEVFGIEAPVLHGAVPLAERDAIVTRFQESPDPPSVLVASLRT